jgi:tape measure domain-containing protein
MAKLGDLIVRIGADTSKLNKELGRVQREMRSMTGNLTQLGQNMTRAITVPLAGLGALAVKSAADLEKLEASFVSLTGGVDQAAAMMKQLNEFTASTPFQIENVANAARQLIASGTEIGEVNNQLRFLGDIAATSGVTIEEIAAIFAKVNAKGKVELENLNQLAERGIPIFKALADATGLPADSLGAGAVSVEQFNTVLKSFAEEGGFAAGAMERLSQTAAGQFSTALDNLKLAGASIGELLLPAVNNLLQLIIKLSQRFAELNPNTKGLILEMGLLLGSIGPLVMAIPNLISGITGVRKAFILFNTTLLSNPIYLVASALATLGTAIVLFRQRTQDAAQTNKEFIDTLVGMDKQAQINHVKEQIRELEREKMEMQAAQRAEMAAQAAGALGDKFDKQIARGNTQKYADQVKFLDERIAGLVTTVREMSKEQEKVEQVTVETTRAIVEETKAIEQAGNKTFWLLVQLNQMSTPQIGGLLDMLEGVKVKLQEVGDVAQETGNAIQSAIQNAVSDSLVALGEGIGKMLSGGLQGVNLMAGALMQLGNLMKSIGKAMVAQATAMITFQKTLFKNPYLAAAAGVAFIAAGSLLSNYATNLQEMPALAEGGLAYGATTAIVGDNPNARIDPEVIAPLSKLQDMMGGQRVEVFGRISGDDIYLSNARTSRNRNRYS